MNQIINYGGDCRTAPAAPGLLNSEWYFINKPGVAWAVLQTPF